MDKKHEKVVGRKEENRVDHHRRRRRHYQEDRIGLISSKVTFPSFIIIVIIIRIGKGPCQGKNVRRIKCEKLRVARALAVAVGLIITEN